MTEILCNLPGEILMRVVRFTPHPCAVLMRQFYATEGWFQLLQHRAMVLYGTGPEVGLDAHLLTLFAVVDAAFVRGIW